MSQMSFEDLQKIKLEQGEFEPLLPKKIYDEILIARTAFFERYAITPSPCEKMRLNHRAEFADKDIYMKMEFSKPNNLSLRTLYYAMQMVKDNYKGVITASAGNFARDLCYCGTSLNIPVTVIIPISAPLHKIKLCEEFQNSSIWVIVKGVDIIEARKYAEEFEIVHNYKYISEDDPEVIAGLGILGLEIIEQVPNLDVLLVPNVYSGALTAGIGVAIKKTRPDVMIVGIHLHNYITSYERDEKDSQFSAVRPIADELVYPGMKRNVYELVMNEKIIDKLMTVPDNLIAHAVMKIVETEKFIVEGSSAATIAALLTGEFYEMAPKKEKLNIVVLLNEANYNPDIISSCIYRGLYMEDRLVEFTVPITKQKYLLDILNKVGESSCLKRISYNSLNVNVVCQIRDKDQLELLTDFLQSHFKRKTNEKVSLQCPIGIL